LYVYYIWLFIFQDKLVVLIRGMFMKKIINLSSNLKKGLHLRTKIKLNECLDIGTEVVLNCGISVTRTSNHLCQP